MKRNSTVASEQLKQSEEADEGMARLDVDGLWMLVTPGCTGYTRWVLADSNEVTLVTMMRLAQVDVGSD